VILDHFLLLGERLGEAKQLLRRTNVAIPTDGTAGGAELARVSVLVPTLTKRKGDDIFVARVDAHFSGGAPPGDGAMKNGNALVSRAHGKPKCPEQENEAKEKKQRRHIAEAIDDDGIFDGREGVELQKVADREVEG